MYNEIKRYFFFKRHYLVDSVCEILYQMIFVLGVCMILLHQPNLNLMMFFLFFTATNTILAANNELEFEIRSGQVDNLHHNDRSIYVVYMDRIAGYFLYNATIFGLSCAVLLLLMPAGLLQPVFSPSVFVMALMHYLFFFLLYLLIIWLTLKFERISVALNFGYACLLIYSGLVFPSAFALSYRNILESASTLVVKLLYALLI